VEAVVIAMDPRLAVDAIAASIHRTGQVRNRRRVILSEAEKVFRDARCECGKEQRMYTAASRRRCLDSFRISIRTPITAAYFEDLFFRGHVCVR
jgi:hypothetical protein